MDILEMVLPIVKDLVIIIVVTIVIPAIGAAIKWWKELTIEDWIKDLVIDGVIFVQERYWDLSGERKFVEAKLWILNKLNEKGITVDDEWLEGLIDSIVNQLRAEYGAEDWYREGK